MDVLSVLFLCTGNSARSILSEAILNRLGEGRIVAYSAGSHPTGRVHPYARALLDESGYPTADLRSKSWDEFAGADSPTLDVVVTVCDNAANEVCPVWPGGPRRVHWSIPDPAAVQGSDAERRRAFGDAYDLLDARIAELLAQFRDSILR